MTKKKLGTVLEETCFVLNVVVVVVAVFLYFRFQATFVR